MDEINFETNQTWQKIERDSKKSGFREGKSDGRDSNFQKSFDDGFAEGFKNGFALGKYKGAVVALSNQSSVDNSLSVVLEKTSRGNCQMCIDQSLLTEDISYIKKKQMEASNTNLKQLYSAYNAVSNVELPETL